MNIYDLTHLMHSGMPVYPGKEQPTIFRSATLEKEGYRELRVEIDGHTGTHIDAPAHMLPNGNTLDKYPASKFIGNAIVIDIPEGTRNIGIDLLEPYISSERNIDFLLLKTGWGDRWGKPSYMEAFPVLTEEAAHRLVSSGISGIGLDAVSVDPVESDSYPIHLILLEGDMVIVENLIFPKDFTLRSCFFHCFPLRLEEADGSPVRAIAIER